MICQPPTRERNAAHRYAALLLSALLLYGCASSSQITATTVLPPAVTAPHPGSALLWLDEEFRSANSRPNAHTSIALGAAQSAAFSQIFTAMLAELTVVAERPEQLAPGQLLIRPRLREVQVAAPSETYLNVYEVWFKYSLQFYDDQLELLDEWFMPAYGKTPDNFMLARSSAIERATDTALRDVGAKLLIDFHRIPALEQWRYQQREQQP